MSIYVLRYGDLYKIGFSSGLAHRVYTIMQTIPGDVEFVGHMPGDREVEAYLHSRFEASRFAGEWFKESPELLGFCAVLCPEKPTIAQGRKASRNQPSADDVKRAHAIIRTEAAHRWPESTHADRVKAMAGTLGWSESRVRTLYYGDPRMALRAFESEAVAAFNRPGTPGERE